MFLISLAMLFLTDAGRGEIYPPYIHWKSLRESSFHNGVELNDTSGIFICNPHYNLSVENEEFWLICQGQANVTWRCPMQDCRIDRQYKSGMYFATLHFKNFSHDQDGDYVCRYLDDSAAPSLMTVKLDEQSSDMNEEFDRKNGLKIWRVQEEHDENMGYVIFDHMTELDPLIIICEVEDCPMLNATTLQWINLTEQIISHSVKSIKCQDEENDLRNHFRSMTNLSAEWKVECVECNGRRACALLHSAYRSEDHALFACQVSTVNNVPVTKRISISTLEKSEPYDLHIEKELGNLKCSASGLPTPTIQWFKDSLELDNSESHWTPGEIVTHINISENGNYSCRVSNVVGSVEKFLVIDDFDDGNKPSDDAQIILPIIISVACLFIFVLLVVLIILIRKNKKRKEVFSLGKSTSFRKGNGAQFNPDENVNKQIDALPYNNDVEFPRTQLTLEKTLGSGEFGMVILGRAFGLRPSEPCTLVAVKTVKCCADKLAFTSLVSELKIMIHIGSHMNVVNLLGACTQNFHKGEIFVLVEYCPHGNIRDYLITNKSKFIDTEELVADVPEHLLNKRENLSRRDLVCWSFQIAQGMEFLISKKVLHGDLAARNVLLADNNIVKIADFGLSRRMYDGVNYKKKSKSPLPVKWMALESLQSQIFSSQSDVWAFGVVLWELFSLGETPYPEIVQLETILSYLLEGNRMEKPQYANDDLYGIMKDCWLKDPNLRPTFGELVDRCGQLLSSQIRSFYLHSSKMPEINDEIRNSSSKSSVYLRMDSSTNSEYLTMDLPEQQSNYLNMEKADTDSVFEYSTVSYHPNVADNPTYMNVSPSSDRESK